MNNKKLIETCLTILPRERYSHDWICIVWQGSVLLCFSSAVWCIYL